MLVGLTRAARGKALAEPPHSVARRSWGAFVASGGGVAEEARTRGFAAQAFAWCAFSWGIL